MQSEVRTQASSQGPRPMAEGPIEIPGGMHHSQLTKYQNVRTNYSTKSYVKYTPEQIELATRLRNLEAKQHMLEKAKDDSSKKL